MFIDDLLRAVCSQCSKHVWQMHKKHAMKIRKSCSVVQITMKIINVIEPPSDCMENVRPPPPVPLAGWRTRVVRRVGGR